MYRYKDVIKNYFEKHSFVESNIKSFNNFMDRGIQKIIDETQQVLPTIIPSEVSEFKIKLGKIEVERPQIVESDGSKRKVFPIEARIRKLTYSAPVYLNVSAIIDGVERESFKALIGKIPIMVKSKYCNLNGLSNEKLMEHYEDSNDPGGYFILNGNERVLIIVEDLVSNKFFVEKSKVGPSPFVGRVYSEKGSYRIPHVIEQMKTGSIYLTVTRFNRVSAIAMIKALGLVKDEDIARFISEDNQYDDVFINLYENVEIKTIDKFFEENKIKHCDFLKIDVEGSEFEILGGSGFKKIAQITDMVFLEWHEWAQRNPNQLNQSLENCGYKIFQPKSEAKLLVGVK